MNIYYSNIKSSYFIVIIILFIIILFTHSKFVYAGASKDLLPPHKPIAKGYAARQSMTQFEAKADKLIEEYDYAMKGKHLHAACQQTFLIAAHYFQGNYYSRYEEWTKHSRTLCGLANTLE